MEVELAFSLVLFSGRLGQIETPQMVAKEKEQRVVLASVVDV